MRHEPRPAIIDGIGWHQFQPMPWVADAACRDADPEIFFIGRGDPGVEAKAYCAACPVRSECLDFAIDGGERHGIWGGMTTKQRRVERLRRNTAA